MFEKAKRLKLYLIFIGIILTIIIELLVYNSSLQKDLTDSTYKTLEEVMHQQRLTFVSKIQKEIMVLNTLSNLGADLLIEDASKEEKLKFLRDGIKDTYFKDIAMSDINGKAVTNKNFAIDISNRIHFKKAIKGESYISEPTTSLIDHSGIIAMAVPIMAGDEIIGTMVGTYDVKNLSNAFYTSFEGLGYAYICDNDGEVIAKTESAASLPVDNLLTAFQMSNIVEYDTYEDILQNRSLGVGGRSAYVFNGQKRFVQYAPLGINNWYICSIALEDAVADTSNSIMKNTIYLSVVTVVLFVLLVLYLFVSQRRYTKKLYQSAYYDELTGLRNLSKLKVDASQILKENPKVRFALAKFDIVRFKMINQMFDSKAGDEIIKTIAKSIGVDHSPWYVSARVNADEFIIFDTAENLLKMGNNREEMKDTLIYATKFLGNHKVEFRYGRYFFEEGETDIEDALEKVNLAHRMAKSHRTLNFHDYDDEVKQKELAEVEVENKMEDALDNGEFKMFLQPKYFLSDESIAGAEALARWWINGTYIMHPADFIPVFEKNGFVTKLDMFMFEEACMFIRSLKDKGICPTVISVNFSRLHLMNDNFVPQLCEIADRYKVSHDLLEIELTESAMFDNEIVLMNVLNELHTKGFTLSMDDFGSGYSSLGLLKNIPIDVVKIDRSFFDGAKDTKRAKTIVESIMQMASKLEIHTVAEGVEIKEHIDMLKEVGCEIVQGYYYAKPMPFEEFENELMKRNRI